MRKSYVSLILATLFIFSQSRPAYALGNWPSAPYAYATSSYVGQWLYGTNGNHTGADLWGSVNGSGSIGPSVYSAYSGYIRNVWWLWDKGGNVYETHNYDGTGQPGVLRSTKYGVSIQNDDGKATFYWHMADQSTFSSWVDSSITVGNWAPQGTYLGRQGNATGVAFVLLHLHFTVGTNYNADFWSTSLDPSPYVGPNLRDGSPEIGNYYTYNGPINCFTPPCPTP